MEWLSDFFFVHDTFVRTMLLDIVLAYSLYITFRAGMWSLAQAGVMAISAYVVGILVLDHDWSLIAALPVGVVVATVAGLLILLPVLRLQGVYLAIATIAFVELVRVAAVNLEVTGGPAGLAGLPSDITILQLLAVVVVAVAAVGALNRSRMGEATGLHATSPLLAQALGVNTRRLRLGLLAIAFVIGAVGAAFGTHVFRVVGPGDYGFATVVELLTYVIVGGTASLAGPIVGVLVLSLPAELVPQLGEYKPLFDGIVLLLAILFFPGGLTSPSQYRGPRGLGRHLSGWLGALRSRGRVGEAAE